MWTHHKQQQHRGAQLPMRERQPRQQGEAPAEAAQGRDAQQHDRADLDVGGETLQPGDYPASPLEHRDGDEAPAAPGDARGDWDDVVQPEPPTELEQDERDDAGKRERSIDGEAGAADRDG